MTLPLVLASSSPYRRELLQRLTLRFSCFSPEIDESPFPGETPIDLACRLSKEKALAVAKIYPAALVIASDQVAELAGQAIGKPGRLEAARQQLSRASGRTLLFHTGLCVYNSSSGRIQLGCVTTEVVFRPLSDEAIDNYLKQEDALDCAGSFKAEGLGISLFEKLSSEDPTALIGLPLILLSTFLLEEGINPLG